MKQATSPSIFDAFFSTAESLNSIAKLAPMVVMMRSDALLAALADPTGYDGTEPVRMVSEKLAAMTEGAVQASLVAGKEMGAALMTGMATPESAFRIASAAIEPMRRTVEANYDRLTRLD